MLIISKLKLIRVLNDEIRKKSFLMIDKLPKDKYIATKILYLIFLQAMFRTLTGFF